MSLGSFDSAPFRWTEPLDSGQYGQHVARFPKSPRGLGFRVEVSGATWLRETRAGGPDVRVLRIAWAVTPVNTRESFGPRAWASAEAAGKPHALRILATVAAIVREWVGRTKASFIVYYPDDEKRDRIYRRMLRRAAPGVTFSTKPGYIKSEVTVTLP